jgi:tetratricopeptide (TPR) repeat protein
VLLNCFASTGCPSRAAAPALLLGACAALLLLPGCAAVPGSEGEAPIVDDRRFDQVAAAMHEGPDATALELLDEIATAYPGLSAPWVNKGIVHAAAGRHEEAEAAFRRALEVAPGDAIAHAELGIVLRRQGRFAEADAAYQAALDLDPDYALAWRNRGVLLDLYLGRPAEALECYERYLQLMGGLESDAQVARWVAELRLRTDSRVANR